MMKSINIRKKIFLLCMTTLLMLLFAVSASAAEQSAKKVRVGYVNALNYEEGGEGEYKKGAGYEYLQKISYLTGWDYEYVYGSFTECCKMLADGEIDLFGNVSYTEERAGLFDFSAYPQGKDTYRLYVRKDRTDLADGDIRKLNGCRIGVTYKSYQEGLLIQWLQDNHIDAEIVRCSGYDEMMPAMDMGKIDVIVAPDLATGYDYLAIGSIGTSDYYFAVSKKRPDILAEINSALFEIQNTEADYNSKLASRYYYKSASGLPLNEDEKRWLSEHDNTLRVGYLDNNMPFSGENNGELSGALKTVTDALEKEYGLNMQFKAYSSVSDMKQALKNNEEDVIGPVVSDYYLAEQNGFVLTDAMVTTMPIVIYKDDYQSSTDIIAATDTSMFGSDISAVLFPDTKIVKYDSIEECLKAVADDRAGCTLIPSQGINALNADKPVKEITLAEMSKQNDIALIATKENRRAATIFNKGIEQASDRLSGVLAEQTAAAVESISFAEFVRENAIIFIGMAAVIIIIMGTLLYRLSVSRRQVVAALEEARSANTANDAKTSFLNNMSHDIRTPMNAIIGFTDIALKDDPNDEVRSCLEKVRQSSDYLLSLINDVLDISRIESGNISFDPAPVDITAVTDSVLDIAGGFIINRDLKLIVHREKPDFRYVLADEVRIREILINIISNAVKFTHDGGSITFESSYIQGADSENVVLKYKITDTGIGMSDEFTEHIFDEFSQEHPGARTQYTGTGLGMAITKRYVDMMGGTIRVDSKKGRGSCFTVELPMKLTETHDETEHKEIRLRNNLTGVRVLLAEDNDLNAELAVVLLTEEGMLVTRTADGEEVVDMFESQPAGSFDVVLMDIMMPKMNGYEATKAIRELPDRPDSRIIPIIAMTANAFAEDVQTALEAGMNAHLAKPIVMEKVKKVIAEQLSIADEKRKDGTD